MGNTGQEVQCLMSLAQGILATDEPENDGPYL